MAIVVPRTESGMFTSNSNGGSLRRSQSQTGFESRGSRVGGMSMALGDDSDDEQPRVDYFDSITIAGTMELNSDYEVDLESGDDEEYDSDEEIDERMVDIDHFVMPDMDDEDAGRSRRSKRSTVRSPSPPLTVTMTTFGDDSSVRAQPSRQVDYLSHDWKEEEIWNSWKYVVARRQDVSNAARLENASWRTWVKSKYQLKTMSPQKLNWLKEDDVTWLYGPLQCSTEARPKKASIASPSDLHTGGAKPILKRRTASELMLQRSLSTSSLMRRATAAVQAQQRYGGTLHPGSPPAFTDYRTLPLPSRRDTRDSTRAPSATQSPPPEPRHIHFNEQVEQCIAVEVAGNDVTDYYYEHENINYESDDGGAGVMMKRIATKRLPVQTKPKTPSEPAAPIIAPLPSTTLKDEDVSILESAQKHSFLRSGNSGAYSEPLKHVKKSGRLFVEDDDDEDDDEPVSLPAVSPTPRSPPPTHPPLHRTPSGMLMPLADPTQPPNADGSYGRVVDIVNTAKDIAHVIWNVGWRK